MKLSFLTFLVMLLAAPAVYAQTPIEPAPSLEVLDVKWTRVERNPRLDEDPFAIIERQRSLQKAQEEALRDNDALRKADLPLVRVPTSASPPSRKDSGPRTPRVTYVYRVTVRNTGTKAIRKLDWYYESYDATTKQFVGRRDYQTRTKILPGQTKKLTAQSASPPVYTVNAAQTDSDQPANRVVIHRIEYSDGSIWNRL